MPIFTPTQMGGVYGGNNTLYSFNDNGGNCSVLYNGIWNYLTYPGPKTYSPTTPTIYYNGLFYIYGDGTSSNLLYSYNPLNNVFTQLATNPTTGQSISALVQANNKLYVIGGNGSTVVGGTGTSLTNVSEYDIVTNTWKAKGNMPYGLFGAGVSINNVIYMMCPGIITSSTYNYSNMNSYAYYPLTDTWVILPYAPPGNVTGLFLTNNVAYGDYIYVFNGYNYNNSNSFIMYRFNTISQSWVTLGSTVTNAYANNTNLWNGNIIIRLYGTTIYKYDVTNDLWIVLSQTSSAPMNNNGFNSGGCVGPIPQFLI